MREVGLRTVTEPSGRRSNCHIIPLVSIGRYTSHMSLSLGGMLSGLKDQGHSFGIRFPELEPGQTLVQYWNDRLLEL